MYIFCTLSIKAGCRIGISQWECEWRNKKKTNHLIWFNFKRFIMHKPNTIVAWFFILVFNFFQTDNFVISFKRCRWENNYKGCFCSINWCYLFCITINLHINEILNIWVHVLHNVIYQLINFLYFLTKIFFLTFYNKIFVDHLLILDSTKYVKYLFIQLTRYVNCWLCVIYEKFIFLLDNFPLFF